MMNKVFHFFLNLSEFFYKKRLIKNLKKHLPKNLNIFIDIGAHYGETTIEFSKYFNIKNAFLFEPNKINFQKLKKNLNYHKKIDKIEIFNFALGNENKKTFLNEVFESSSSTINSVNQSSKYFSRKKNILKFFSKNQSIIQREIEIKDTKKFIQSIGLIKIDFLKIDTEGYEFLILKNLNEFLKNIGLILFEHHFDLMIEKNYKIKDIKTILLKNNFKQVHKSKMMFRKSFEYIYINKDYKFE